MAERRMFSKKVIDTDMFIDMPATARLLYYELAIRADDDGFVDSPKKIMRIVGCQQNDFDVLIAKSFILDFESGIIVIKHWKLHNYIQKDRYKKSIYSNEKRSLVTDENGIYVTTESENIIQQCIDVIDEIEPEEKIKKTTKRFKKPTVQEIRDYTDEIASSIDSEKFYDYYESNGWKVGKNSMKDWKAAVRNWEKNNKERSQKQQPKKNLNFDDLELDEYGNLKGVF